MISSVGKQLSCINKYLHFQKRCHSSTSLYITGHGWSGAFGTGPETITSSATSYVSDEERENGFKPIHIIDDDANDGDVHGTNRCDGHIVDAAAGWGHTVVLCKGGDGDGSDVKMYVAGRPYDFQSLLRLNRLPSFIRRAALTLSLTLDEDTGWSKNGESAGATHSETSDPDETAKKNQDLLFTKFHKSIFPYFEQIRLPNNDVPVINTERRSLVASAGFTGVIGKSGNAYMFGLNRSGQCGVGNKDLIHIWEPTKVTLPDSQKNAVTDIALGLQHGMVLDETGKVYVWGKASRGQLGVTDEVREMNAFDDSDTKSDFQYSPIHIDLKADTNLSDDDAIVKRIGAGWNHSAVVTNSNDVWIWGKNVLINESEDGTVGARNAVDSLVPVQIKGLPNNLEVTDISCGSHHTSILMEDGSVFARGISTDTKEPVGGDNVVQIVPPGLIDMPVKQFKSHFDRTTIVAGENGCQVLEVQLWSTEDLRDCGVFQPAWVETLLSDCDGIDFVHRGWHHTLVVGQHK